MRKNVCDICGNERDIGDFTDYKIIEFASPFLRNDIINFDDICRSCREKLNNHIQTSVEKFLKKKH